MPVNPDFRDLFAGLNASGARYLLVGGYAVAFHAEPRFTKDLDVWTEPTPENARRVFDALRGFGAPLEGVTAADLAQPGMVVQIGMPPNRIDGVTFDDAWQGRATTSYGDQRITLIGREDLIRNKRASRRPRDLLDLELLEKHR